MTQRQPLSLLSQRSQTPPCMLPLAQAMLTRYNALLDIFARDQSHTHFCTACDLVRTALSGF